MTLILLLLGALAVIAGCNSPGWRGTPYDPPRPAAEITGINWDNTTFQLSDLRGKIALLYFGYTYCPDVCPTTMAEMRKLMERLGARADKVAVVFVSVDPERDTPARLAEYVPFFDRRFYGVQVPADVLEQVKRDYGVYAEKRPYVAADGVETYTVDHTARIFLVDQAGALRLSFPYGTPVDDMRSDILRLLK
ncbi:MAG: SCO family protein [Anaerolineae bacterium]|nr:SCO family protein [Anaerolineae bacterium]